jgi:putative Holliday junction resolvase
VSERRRGVIAIDHGERRTGFAATDGLRISSTALEPFRGAGDDPALLEHLARHMSERDVEVLVVGLPLNMDGSEGPRAAAVRRFMEALRTRFPDVLVVAQDERLTTVEAQEWMRSAGVKDRRAARDAYSAMVILRDWIAAGEPR